MKEKIKSFLIGILIVVALTIFGLLILTWPPSFFRKPYVTPVAKAESAMAQIQAKAKLIYDKEKSYYVLSCNYDDAMRKFCDDIEKRIEMKPIIYVAKEEYCAYIKLNSRGYYCIDSTGTRRETLIDPSGYGYCNRETFICPTD